MAAGQRTVNPADEHLYVILETIIKELAGLFPGRYIHIGGDEVSTRGWREVPEMPAFMEKNGIESYDDIQKYFERRLSAIVTAAGKVSIAWDDTIDSGLDKDNTVIHWWRADHPESLKKALEAVEGVSAAVADHNKGTAVVTLSQPVADEVLRKAVEDQDYEVTAVR